jgi:hypothetical protein
VRHPGVLILLLLAACSEPPGPGARPGLDQAERLGDPSEDVVAYAELCKSELGISGPLPAMSCLQGKEIPITVDGKPLDDEVYARLAAGGGCDRVQWLPEACYNYDLIQKIDLGSDVEAILNCRQKYWTNPRGPAARALDYQTAAPQEQVEKFKLYAEFNDLGYILRNRTTGKSCYFTIFGQQFYGGWLAPPDQAKLPPQPDVLAQIADPKPPPEYPTNSWYRDARATYFTAKDTAGGGCVGCHDLGAFKHSPFVDQTGLVPHNPNIPFLPVGQPFQEAFRSRKLVDVTTDPVGGQPQKCTTCHRLVSGGANCDHIIDWATGHNSPSLSSWGTSFPQAAWMPLGHQLTSADEYNRTWGPHVARIKCCCEKPYARGCLSRPFGPTVEELGEVADGQSLAPFQAAPADAADSCL